MTYALLDVSSTVKMSNEEIARQLRLRCQTDECVVNEMDTIATRNVRTVEKLKC